MAEKVYLLHVEKLFQGISVFGVLEDDKKEGRCLVGLVYSPNEEIDGHWFVRVTCKNSPKTFDPVHDKVIGVTSHKERIESKLYISARSFVENYSRENGRELVDETLPGQSQNYQI